MSDPQNDPASPPGAYRGVIVRDAETGEILAVEMLDETAELPPEPESWLKRNAKTLDALRPVTEAASLAGSPVLRAVVAGAWLVVDAARLREEPREEGTRLRRGLRAASIAFAGLGIVAGIRSAPKALRARKALIGALRRAAATAEQTLRAKDRQPGPTR